MVARPPRWHRPHAGGGRPPQGAGCSPAPPRPRWRVHDLNGFNVSSPWATPSPRACTTGSGRTDGTWGGPTASPRRSPSRAAVCSTPTSRAAAGCSGTRSRTSGAVALAAAPDLIVPPGGNGVLLRTSRSRPGRAGRRGGRPLRPRVRRSLLFTVLEHAGGSGRFADAWPSHRGVQRWRGQALRSTPRRRPRRRRRATDAARPPAVDEDRLHLAPEGHRRVSAAVLEALGTDDERLLDGPPGWWRQPLPVATPPSRVGAVTAEVRWVRRHLLPWVGRRLRGTSSGDAVAANDPELVELRPPA